MNFVTFSIKNISKDFEEMERHLIYKRNIPELQDKYNTILANFSNCK